MSTFHQALIVDTSYINKLHHNYSLFLDYIQMQELFKTNFSIAMFPTVNRKNQKFYDMLQSNKYIVKPNDLTSIKECMLFAATMLERSDNNNTPKRLNIICDDSEEVKSSINLTVDHLFEVFHWRFFPYEVTLPEQNAIQNTYPKNSYMRFLTPSVCPFVTIRN